jgi:ABC-type antimicrobial peptide transport system permease subunit
MFIRATLRQASHDPGVEMDRIAVAVVNFQNGGPDEGRIRRTIDRILEEGRREAGLESVAASTGLPFGVHPALQVALAKPEESLDSVRQRAPIAALAATPSLFRTLGVEIVRGRGFTDADDAAATPVVVLSALTARQWFGAADAVGQSLALRHGTRDQVVTVIGVAADTDVGFAYSNRRPLVYLPLAQHVDGFITISARGTGRGTDAVPLLRDAIRRADVDLGVDTIGGGRQVLSGPFAILRSGGLGTLYLGGFTLLLSMVGLFGVQSHVVAFRTREIGVRMSLGASASQIKMMVMRDGYRPVLEGLVLGLWGGIAARFVVRAYTEVDVSIIDPWMLVVTPIPLVLAAFCACYLPAARAARVDPTVALRCE